MCARSCNIRQIERFMRLARNVENKTVRTISKQLDRVYLKLNTYTAVCIGGPDCDLDKSQ